MAEFDPSSYPDGYRVFNDTKVAYPSLEEMGFTQVCLFGFSVSWTRSGTLVASNCLRSEPSWMYDNREKLENLKVAELTLPGTHDSGSYETDFIKEEEYLYIAITQEETLLNQLIWGVRYLDIRCVKVSLFK